MTTTLRKFRQLTLDERTQIGEFYRQGMKAKEIAPLYETDSKTVNNAIHFLRNNGVILPFKNKKVKKTREILSNANVLPAQESSVPDVAPVKASRRKYANSEKRGAYNLYRTTGDIGSVMNAYNVNKKVAYYLVWQGRKLSGVKGKVRVKQHLDHTPVAEEKSDGIGFFFLGLVVGLLVMWII